MPTSDDEELFVKTEEDEVAHYWRVVDVDYGIASCVNLNTEQVSFFEISKTIMIIKKGRNIRHSRLAFGLYR